MDSRIRVQRKRGEVRKSLKWRRKDLKRVRR
jgi:hypothetical protein